MMRLKLQKKLLTTINNAVLTVLKVYKKVSVDIWSDGLDLCAHKT